mgnify:CR=1 FL=1
MSTHEYVTLGNSGLRVSPLCLGTMTFGEEWDFGSDVETSRRVIDAYLDWGGNFLDTANIYTKGHSEVVIGDHLGKDPAKRDRAVIATKFAGNMFRGDPNAGGMSRKAVIDQCEHSLRRLQTDYIDLYWLHFYDETTPIEETMRALDDLVRDGKVRYVGFSDTPAWKCTQAQMFARAHGFTPLVALQVEYSLIERTPEGDLIPMSKEMGMGVTPWSPLAMGILTGKYTRENIQNVDSRRDWVKDKVDERTLTIVDALLEVARDADCTPAQAALAWCRQREGVDSVIIGARTMDQLESNLASMDVTLTDKQIETLDGPSKPDLNFPHQFLERVPTAVFGETTVDGVTGDEWNLGPKTDDERW